VVKGAGKGKGKGMVGMSGGQRDFSLSLSLFPLCLDCYIPLIIRKKSDGGTGIYALAGTERQNPSNHFKPLKPTYTNNEFWAGAAAQMSLYSG
jgi:hypothetical protein